jgi:hypothetical protein
MQVRAELVDNRLGAAFSRWYPGFTEENQLYRVALRPHHLNHSQYSSLDFPRVRDRTSTFSQRVILLSASERLPRLT